VVNDQKPSMDEPLLEQVSRIEHNATLDLYCLILSRMGSALYLGDCDVLALMLALDLSINYYIEGCLTQRLIRVNQSYLRQSKLEETTRQTGHFHCICLDLCSENGFVLNELVFSVLGSLFTPHPACVSTGWGTTSVGGHGFFLF
jgi:hypothetical protein